MTIADPLYDLCGAFLAELAAQGVERVVVSPGSRSTPLAVSARAEPGLDHVVVLDERSAAFVALGAAKASGRPVALICTSGTAAANYLPAVVEAHHSGVPLVVLTADRPAELRGWGAGQTIDQVGLYGTHVRWFAEMPEPREATVDHARRAALRAVVTATGTDPGPVHLNWPIRKPLEPVAPVAPRDLGAPLSRARPRLDPTDAARQLAALVIEHERGLLAPGPLPPGDHAGPLAELARRSGWPLWADAASQLRRSSATAGAPVIGHGDLLARSLSFTAHHRPDVVVRVGATPVSQPLGRWLEADRPPHVVLVDPAGRWEEPTFGFDRVLAATPAELATATLAELDRRGWGGRAETAWSSEWLVADTTAASTVQRCTAAAPMLSAAVVRTLGSALPAGAALYLSNSMPVRDVESFLPLASDDLAVHVNRGANGIDGMVSSAAGVAMGGQPTVLLAGDLAVLHDLGGFVTAGRLGSALTVVVPNNRGGGIFGMLPIAAHGDDVGFTELFDTPHDVDLAVLAGLPGVSHCTAHDTASLTAALVRSIGAPGVHVVEVPIDGTADLAQHRAVAAAVDAALAGDGTTR